MNIREYQNLKAAGNVLLRRAANGDIELVQKQWDKDTGLEIDSTVYVVNIESFNNQKSYAQGVLTNTNVFIADHDKVP